MKKTARFIIALPIAVPLMVIGWALSKVWKPFAVLILIGMWLLGEELDFG